MHNKKEEKEKHKVMTLEIMIQEGPFNQWSCRESLLKKIDNIFF